MFECADYNAVALSDDNRYLLNVSPWICLCQNERFPSKSAFEARPPTVYLIHATYRINMKAGGLWKRRVRVNQRYYFVVISRCICVCSVQRII